MTPSPLWRAVLLGWLLTGAVLLVVSWGAIQRLTLPDPDDVMRLMQVRDLVAGQSWWDVSQYRLVGGAMHWSRLVDLPIAAVILLTQPLLGAAGAERAALLVVPLLTLLAVIALAAHLSRRMADDRRAGFAVLLAALSVPLLQQLRPLRIDHHGWQVVAALAALYLLVGRPSLRNGALMGLALALLISISLEGLPIAAALAGIAALAWAFDPTRRVAMLGTGWGLFASTVLIQLATRGVAYEAPLCDAITPDWLAVLGTAAIGLTLASFAGRAALAVRIGALGLAGAAALAVLLLRAPECVRGPFAQLDPLTRDLWYLKVSEGLPFWDQEPVWAIMTVGLPIVGLLGSCFAFRASEGAARARWLLIIAAQVPALILAALVMRAGATANAFALPGAAFALDAMLTRARAVERVLPRMLATAAALLAAAPGLAAVALLGIPQPREAATTDRGDAASRRALCTSAVDARAVGALPPALLFAPLDITPDIIAFTHHRAIASGHHRNMAQMHDVIAAFTGTPEAAHAIVRRYGAAYVVACPGYNELEIYRVAGPRGFWAQLDSGARFDWLEPVAIPGSPVRVWRVTR